MNSDSDSLATPPRPAKTLKKWYNTPFNDDWLKHDKLKGWLEKDAKSKYNALCKSKVCVITLKNPNKSSLLAHEQSTKHQKSVKAKCNTLSMPSFLTKPRPDMSAKIATAEIKLSGFFVEHHVPFAQADHLVKVLKEIFPDNKIAQNIKMAMGKTKTSYIVNDIAREEKFELAKILQSQKFSVIIDETTDISIFQILGIVVRYLDYKRSQVVNAMLDTVEIENGTGAGLYEKVKEVMLSKNIPMNNIIGLGCDNCATMMGGSNGFKAYMLKDLPSLFVLGCTYVIHLHFVQIMQLNDYHHGWKHSKKDITSYFCRSSKRQHEFEQFQETCKLPQHAMLKLSQTRWLSRGKVVSRVLEQWDALLLFFKTDALENKVDGAETIYKAMINNGTKHMLLFVNYVLQKVDSLNLEYQSASVRIRKVHSIVSDGYRYLLSLFVKSTFIESMPLWKIEPSVPYFYKDIHDIDLGRKCDALLAQQPLLDQENRFRLDCLRFLVELCSQIKRRFDFSETSILSQMCVLDPKVAMSASNQTRPKSLAYLASKFSMLVEESQLDQLHDQWKMLPTAVSTLQHMINKSRFCAVILCHGKSWDFENSRVATLLP